MSFSPETKTGWNDQLDPRWIAAAKPGVTLLRHYHSCRVEGLEHLPLGPALLVGNHGLLGYETFLLFESIYTATRRFPRGLAERWFFRVPGLRDALLRLGGVYGNADNALSALAQGHLVVCYPGGAREVFKHHDADRYRLKWKRSLGFIRIARRAGVPIVPFAAAGVDDTYRILPRTTFPLAHFLGRLGGHVMGHEKYEIPVVWARGPFPYRVPFWFRLGAPIDVTSALAPGQAEEAQVALQHAHVWQTTQSLLDTLLNEWRERKNQ